MRNASIFLVCLLALGSCGPAVYVDKTWRDPETTIDVNQMKKVLVVAFLKTEVGRHNAEDELTEMLKGKGVASYSYLAIEPKPENRDAILQKLEQDGFDAAMVLRLVDVDKDINYVPGSYTTYPIYYRDFWGYYWNSFNTASATYSPGYFETTRTYSLEMNIYSLEKNKLVWSGLTSYTDPSNANKLIEGSAKTMFKAMRKQGFIKG